MNENPRMIIELYEMKPNGEPVFPPGPNIGNGQVVLKVDGRWYRLPHRSMVKAKMDLMLALECAGAVELNLKKEQNNE